MPGAIIVQLTHIMEGKNYPEYRKYAGHYFNTMLLKKMHIFLLDLTVRFS